MTKVLSRQAIIDKIDTFVPAKAGLSINPEKTQNFSPGRIERIDKSRMIDVLQGFPEQCRLALGITTKAKLRFGKTGINKIIFSGVGGSASGADLVRSYLYLKCKIPVCVLREFSLPAFVDNSTLAFILSYSGNTEEALSSYQQARKKKAKIIVISSGGKLKDYAFSDKVDFIELPKGIPPRCALGYLSIIPLGLLAKLGFIKSIKIEAEETIRVLERLRQNSLNPCRGPEENIAKSVAQRLWNHFVAAYSCSMHFDVCALRFRSHLAENAKALSSSNFFPETSHNEIEGWHNPKQICKGSAVVLFRDKNIHPRISKRMDIFCSMLKKEGITPIEIWAHGKGLLAKILSSIYTGDLISYYLAILYSVDPTPIERIEYLKQKMAGKESI